jgi:hypothetical protein
MNHAKTSHQHLQLDHDHTSQLPSKSSQPPIDMASKPLLDRDTAVYYSKYYRQALATAPACAVSVLAGVSSLLSGVLYILTFSSLHLRTSRPACNRKSKVALRTFHTDSDRRYFSSAIACTQYTFRTEGFRGFFAGMSVT